MSLATETTRLLSDQTQPQYAFDTSLVRERKKRIKQFQCCLCVIFVCCLVVAFLIAAVWGINRAENSFTNVTNTSSPSDTLTTLLAISWPRPDKPMNTSYCNNQSEWSQALAAGLKALNTKHQIEKNVTEMTTDSPSYKHQKVFLDSNKTQALANLGYLRESARRFFPNNGSTICNKAEPCPVPQKCTEFAKFRTFDGTCNNLERPNLGAAFQPFRRALPPDYADGVSSPRGAKTGALPSARTVSLEVHRPFYKNDDKFSVMLAVWGQFLDHDMTATAPSRGPNGSTIACCGQKVTHPECFPVKLDRFDPLSEFNVTCMEFVRSANAATCCLGPREQMNQVTAFIDGSVIYGVEEKTVGALRTMSGGELEMFVTSDNRTLLPVSKDLTDGCNRLEESRKGRYCFLTGDGRANENLHLTSMHLIWARQHNSIAKQLAKLNPDWADERLFQESRKIIGAQMQHICYREFLPILLGRGLMEKSGLYPRTSGYFTEYNSAVDPSIANNFATAAFRFAHSIIPGLMKFLAKDSSSPEFVQLHKMLFDPFRLYQAGGLDRALRGAMDTPIQANDPYFSSELKDKLFEDAANETIRAYGLDLVSLNIQRGRDHGLVGYNSWREHCGLRRVSTFQQLQGDFDDDSLRNIQAIYRDVDDVDLYTGALSEKPLNGSILGPTLTCLIHDQFVRVKYGDRFWYENPHWFTLDQLAEIRKTSLARIICDNSDEVDEVQPLVMEKIRSDNKVVPCSALPAPQWGPWKEALHRVRTSADTLSVESITN
ncbi:peroxidase isoform X1 [Tribolium castaneum]|uniref:Chorion peroxidase-like Protein n=1 Tax=Tribolium castaneum TaxID=7070 RepID=D6W863_TRICA|nr:PREDICTED: peroxidase isoform X2 [Tribolium castaneum]XP_015840803.1 PREDICTED: peroxidase isoform X2 [Tribolium castaneum]XP_015840810.1 PREDICTED: peroxidase isoform X2 [Tribolium castaneum]EFA11560.1 Chorion peroxidase-like Protein [Tribolium castaneum]|eukprot:XP_008200769.1 PREDICTED: peroxidase isoform X2 [Tribolium castaneum]